MKLKCPYCGKTERWKWNNPKWMEFTPGPMELWRCASCGKEYTLWWWMFAIKTHIAHNIVTLWRIAVALVILFALLFVLE
ncbi:MAG: hypothetical protein IJS46_00915 [Kiritimatiellae bacterium]|nr:hypothetical protein [Kiritimatiellia bacterium]